jgi:hypothetical protein
MVTEAFVFFATGERDYSKLSPMRRGESDSCAELSVIEGGGAGSGQRVISER